MTPVCPSTMFSRGPPDDETTTGNPLASASSTTLPAVSVALGKTKQSAEANTSDNGSRARAPVKTASGNASRRVGNNGPSPAMMNRSHVGTAVHTESGGAMTMASHRRKLAANLRIAEQHRRNVGADTIRPPESGTTAPKLPASALTADRTLGFILQRGLDGKTG
jgi:hypothetical protein